MAKRKAKKERVFKVISSFKTSKKEYKKGDLIELSHEGSIEYLINKKLISE